MACACDPKTPTAQCECGGKCTGSCDCPSCPANQAVACSCSQPGESCKCADGCKCADCKCPSCPSKKAAACKCEQPGASCQCAECKCPSCPSKQTKDCHSLDMWDASADLGVWVLRVAWRELWLRGQLQMQQLQVQAVPIEAGLLCLSYTSLKSVKLAGLHEVV
ncbi:hypothetical protein CC85DRAFT_293703 [Cutaneotrichosporon oleaginosum]|uniref:Uncharacterized protein n=1 Tax=Cutaneotrichosporon oleaginosum TaxID=879819 RepID=A0A0J0XEY1_9TREE|nr:uncharacterized protein CC85DRAFT_293703 [Cutaneotrichosporon oleaginosum]KLT39621.1 hypothetical protein CC85DRAFT_293703 [Cutaneotrichosporon oleaginosum]TXT05641.1 hypothetical protein COLE_06961 [Cutaneotrichosporon oleaginosum]